jgi:hypothetical protein
VAENVVYTVLGVVLIALAGRDVFDALFHPEGRGTLGRMAMRIVWRLFTAGASRSPRLLPLAGPVALLAVISGWALLLTLGWSFIYLPHLDDAFRWQPGTQRTGFLSAVHISLVTLTTLGSTDSLPTADWLRVVSPLEALLGFGLLSASISWLLLIYPVLARRRSLAYEVWLLLETERRTGTALEDVEPEAAQRVYAELTSRLIAVERDFVNFPISYYFAEEDERFSLAAVAPALLRMGRRGADAKAPEGVRLRAVMLVEALSDLGATAARFHRGSADTTAAALAAYAHDHRSAVDAA